MEKDMKKLLFWIIDCWRVIMDNRFNPLRFIADPSVQAYFTLVLFTMWSVFFGFIATYYMGWYGYSIVNSIVVHLAIIIPIIFTNITFQEAERDGAKWYMDYRKEQRLLGLFPTVRTNVVPWDLDKEA